MTGRLGAPCTGHAKRQDHHQRSGAVSLFSSRLSWPRLLVTMVFVCVRRPQLHAGGLTRHRVPPWTQRRKIERLPMSGENGLNPNAAADSRCGLVHGQRRPRARGLRVAFAAGAVACDWTPTCAACWRRSDRRSGARRGCSCRRSGRRRTSPLKSVFLTLRTRISMHRYAFMHVKSHLHVSRHRFSIPMGKQRCRFRVNESAECNDLNSRTLSKLHFTAWKSEVIR